MPSADATLDTLGLFCPIPVILTSKKIKTMSAAEVLEVLSDDPGIQKDMPIWCRESGHTLLDVRQEGTVIRLYVRKDESPP